MAEKEDRVPTDSDQGAGGIVYQIDERLGTIGSALIRRPAIVTLLVLVLPAMYILSAVLGGPSWILYLFHEQDVKPELQPLVSTSELIFDAAVGAFLPLATLLITSVLMIYGFLKEARKGNATSASRQLEFDQHLTLQINQLVQGSRSEIDHLVDKASATLHEHMEVLSPGWAVSVADPAIRDNMKSLTLAIRRELDRTTEEHRVVVRSVFRGMTRRFQMLTTSLAQKGSFMDPNERRELTEDLYVSTKSYHVIFYGFRPLGSGDWRWHDDYLHFLERARNAHGEHVTWTFADWDEDAAQFKELAIREVQALGISCFVFGRAGTTGDVGRDVVEAFLRKGPLIEVFGRDFPTGEKCNLPGNANLTWKSTSLRIRTSGAQDIEWEPGGVVCPPEEEGVWAADNIDKLVRADVVAGPHTDEFRVLDKICQHRKLQIPN